MKTFKDLVNQVTVNWLAETVREKSINTSENFANFGNLGMIPGISINQEELKVEFNKIINQILILKTFGDVVAFTKMNKIDTQSILKDGFNPGNLSKLLGENITAGQQPSMSKIIAKIQLATIFDSIEKIINEIRVLQDKIGRDTPMDQIDLEDLNYLLNRSIKEESDRLNNFTLNSSDITDEIGTELSEVGNSTVDWEKRMNDKEIIKIFLSKYKDNYIKNNITVEALSGSLDNSKPLEDLAKMSETISDLSMRMDFANDLLKNFNKSN